MLRLYIVRHGETEWNVEKRMQGWKDSSLTQKGREDAVKLGEYLRNIEFRAIYSSPSSRTMDTAELIRGERNLEIIQDENLREIRLGKWEGLTTTEVEGQYPEQYFNFFNRPHIYQGIEGESFKEVESRARIAIEKIIKIYHEGNVLVVTHSAVIKTLMAYFEKRRPERIWEPPFIYGTSVCMIEIHDGEYKVILHGDISHLQNKQ